MSGQQAHGGGSGSGQEESMTTPFGGHEISDEIIIDAVPDISEPYHPSTVINDFLLKSRPDAQVAITHDNHWRDVIRARGDTTFPKNSELLRRVFVSSTIVSINDGVFLAHTGDSMIRSPAQIPHTSRVHRISLPPNKYPVPRLYSRSSGESDSGYPSSGGGGSYRAGHEGQHLFTSGHSHQGQQASQGNQVIEDTASILPRPHPGAFDSPYPDVDKYLQRQPGGSFSPYSLLDPPKYSFGEANSGYLSSGGGSSYRTGHEGQHPFTSGHSLQRQQASQGNQVIEDTPSISPRPRPRAFGSPHPDLDNDLQRQPGVPPGGSVSLYLPPDPPKYSEIDFSQGEGYKLRGERRKNTNNHTAKTKGDDTIDREPTREGHRVGGSAARSKTKRRLYPQTAAASATTSQPLIVNTSKPYTSSSGQLNSSSALPGSAGTSGT